MEHHHEIIKPVRDIVRSIGEFLVDKLIPGEVFDDFGQNGHGRGFDNSPLDEPVFKQQDFGYDSEGNYFNPDPVPDIRGREL